MFTTDYYKQAITLPVENEFQVMHLKLTDAVTFVRETCKWGMVASLVVIAASVIFNFDSTSSINCAIGATIAFFTARKCAQILEPQAEEMIRDFKEKRKYMLSLEAAKSMRLVD